MAKERQDARARILQAAGELAWESGPGGMALDAVAARAGLSKGGLLYHFPTKAKLLEALVEEFVREFDRDLAARESAVGGEPNATARAYLELFSQEQKCRRPPPSGLLAAMAEGAEFLDPVRHYQRVFLDRMKATASDPAMAIVVFLAIQGIKSMDLMTIDTLEKDEIAAALGKLGELLG